MRQFAAWKDENAWLYRLHRHVRDHDPADIIDGYQRAAAASRDRAPTLLQFVDAIRAQRADRLRAAEHIEAASAPRFTGGIAGYVETVLAPNALGSIAERAVADIREILGRPRGDAERLDESLALHDEIMRAAPAIRRRGEYHGCAVPTCNAPGNFSPSAGSGGGPWFCAQHWRAP